MVSVTVLWQKSGLVSDWFKVTQFHVWVVIRTQVSSILVWSLNHTCYRSLFWSFGFLNKEIFLINISFVPVLYEK